MSQTQVFRGTARRKVHNSDHVAFYYHDTPVVELYFGHIILNSGGYHSATTRTAINQVANEYNLGFKVYQRDYQWFVDHSEGTVKFEDGMSIPRNN